MNRRPWSRTAIAILLGTALAAAIPLMPAVGEQSPAPEPSCRRRVRQSSCRSG
jgi:hypothetical protein